ncbi:MAG TPA: hypothetical protein VGR62_25800 [Candidatus Binatia bacterium]|jgi:hypothetical protein|nr:hypothetical protein [Candidatus Binatia bacterium]
MRRAVVFLALLVVTTAPVGAAVCQQAKLNAVAQRTSSSLKCGATAVRKGVPMDSACLTKAADAYAAAFTKAERIAAVRQRATPRPLARCSTPA